MSSSAPVTAVTAVRWPCPLLAYDRYDRTPQLTPAERETIAAFLARRATGAPVRWSATRRAVLHRLLEPMTDVLNSLQVPISDRWIATTVLLSDMLARDRSFWAWSEAEWVETIGATQRDFIERYAPLSVGKGRTDVLALAYLFEGLCDLSLFPVAGLHHETLAARVFGRAAVEAPVLRVMRVLETWGYAPSRRRGIRFAVCSAFLANRSPFLEDLTTDLLAQLRARTTVPNAASTVGLLSRALAHLGLLERALPTGSQPLPGWARRETAGIAPEWVGWCARWHGTATRLSPASRNRILNTLLRVGRWLASQHPDVVSPAQWTYALAADWVAAVDQMCVGDWLRAQDGGRYGMHYGKPLMARTKVHYMQAVRAFFRDIYEEPHNIPRRFDPDRAFRAPEAIRRHLAPNPRDLDPLIWARIVHAALHLTEDDLPSRFGCPLYPFALVHAVAVVWCYAALRANEICRLHVGCIRWQREDVLVPDSGELLPKDAVCFLTVPVNKTSGSFPKAVNPLVGKVIAEWERLRPPDQPVALDVKTGEMVDYLFSFRGRRIAAAYINESLIPMLCAKAGLPHADERGPITSHRARATIATLLYNAPEGLSIWELMQWLGHRNPSSTQHYARIKPTKLATAYMKAERTSHLIEVLVDLSEEEATAPRVYYVLGDHGLCSNPEWYTCLYRMACLKCPFFIPEDQALLIKSRAAVESFLKHVELTSEEIAAVEEDRDKIIETYTRTCTRPAPRLLHQRAKGTASRGIPLTVLNAAGPVMPGTAHSVPESRDGVRSCPA